MVKPMVDLSSLNLTDHAVPEEQLRTALPHEHEFRMIDDICYLDPEGKLIVGYKVWDENPWWARGHIPGRPLMPGVLMIEGCAQAAGVLVKGSGMWPEEAFCALAGVTQARCRRMITAPSKVFFVATLGKQTTKIARFPVQCIIDGEVALDGECLGVPV